MSGGSRRLLIVDDNCDAADTLAMFFQLTGHDVRVAYNGWDALTAVDEFKPNVIFLDIVMRGMTGITAIRKIRAMPITQPMIVTISGYPRHLLDMGDDLRISRHYLKPIDPRELVKLLSNGDDCHK